MPLHKAHEGYEYQDLLASSFILTELLHGNNSTIKIDKKEFKRDIIDDITIINSNYTQKKQIKYSGGSNKHQLSISDLTINTRYNISITQLFNTWYESRYISNLELKLCLTWKLSNNKILNFLIKENVANNFYNTKIFRLDYSKIWEDKDTVNTEWKEVLNIANCTESNFKLFCEHLLIEIEYPEFSNDIYNPGNLEQLVLFQCKKLGIGMFPNDKLTTENFLLNLIHIVKQYRGRKNNTELNTKEIIFQLGIKCDFGKIDQRFPINTNENVSFNNHITRFLQFTNDNSKILLIGEPGSGKSYFVHNLQKRFEKKGAVVIKHLCYTKLDDELYAERIKKDILIGNLVSAIITKFPDLQNVKNYKYGSDINELNLLIEKIVVPTYIIIDGLDHIERIFYFRNVDFLNKSEVAIIETVIRIKSNPNVKIIIVSQNIKELNQFEDYSKYFIESWKEKEVIAYLKRNRISNVKVDSDLLLSKVLFDKSEGNALYLKFLIDEYNKNSSTLFELPRHQHNLGNYYSYLLNKLDIGNNLPQILSGVNFSLTLNELREISKNGTFVEKSIETLRPILKINLTDNGFVIYHESFRRYILEKLKNENVSIESKVYQPIIEWFSQKCFFQYGKCFKQYLKILLLNNRHEEIIELFDKNFVIKSVLDGNPWHYLVANFHIFKQSVTYLNRLDKLILLNEIHKVIVSTEDFYYQLFPQYLECLGFQKGYELALESLLFNNRPTIDVSNGLKICYFCDIKGIVAPWSEYFALVDSETRFDNQDMKYYYRGLICTGNKKQLINIAKSIIQKGAFSENIDFINELKLCRDKPFIEKLINEDRRIEDLTKYTFDLLKPKYNINSLIDKIIRIKSVYSNEIDWLNSFFILIDNTDTDFDSVIAQLNTKEEKNWFFYWVMFHTQILAKKNQKLNEKSIDEIFKTLTISTEPFKGEPRTCDLFHCVKLVHRSIKTGLTLIENEKDWSSILDILLKVSEETATSFQRQQSGPLSALEFIEILVEFHSSQNKGKIEEILDYLLKDKADYHLYFSLAEYYYTVSSLFYKNNKNEKGNQYFNLAVNYTLAYTPHKDYYFEDPLKACSFLSLSRNNTTHQKDFETLYSCALEIYSHTNGKGTRHYPIQWFEYYSKFDFNKAGLFLIDNLINNNYNWWDSDSIIELLQNSLEQTEPLLQFYICYTYPVKCDHEYLKYALRLLQNLEKIDTRCFEQYLARISPHFINKEPDNLTDEMVESYNNIVCVDYPHLISNKFKEKETYMVNGDFVSETLSNGFQIDDNYSIILFLKEAKIDEFFLSELNRIFKQDIQLTETIKSYVSILVQRTNHYDYRGVSIDKVFAQAGELDCYYWMSKYIHYVDGWFTKCSKIEYFEKSFSINPKLAIQFLFELISLEYNDGYFRSGISSNLIQSLVKVGYNKAEIERMWVSLKDVLLTRFPNFNKRKISKKFSNPENLNSNEILICILISLYRIQSTEKSQWIISCLSNLVNDEDSNIVKPILWLFKNRSHFPYSLISSVLKLLFHSKLNNSEFYKQFDSAVAFKSNKSEPHFSIDYYSFNLFNKAFTNLVRSANVELNPLEHGLTDFLLSLNYRFRILKRAEININPVFSKFMLTKNSASEGKHEKFWSNVHKCFVQNTINAEYMDDLLNTQLYNELCFWSMIEDDILLNQAIGIDVETISAKCNSIRLRPTSLLTPAEFIDKKSVEPPKSVNGWIRLGHLEHQKDFNIRETPKNFKTLGAMMFANKDDPQDFPFSTYHLFPHQIWNSYFPNFELEKEVVFLLTQKDHLENYELLWLNPVIVEKLGLITNNSLKGLYATNNKGEEVLKLNVWYSNYLGTGYGSSLNDEIPTLIGCDLIITEHYFNLLKSYYNNEPNYFTIKVQEIPE